MLRICLCVILVGSLAGGAHAQTLGQRIAAIGEGTARLSFAARSGVCGSGGGNISAAANERELAGDPVLPATLADSVTVWPSLLRLARIRSLPEDRRRSAIFLVGAGGRRRRGAGPGFYRGRQPR
jgi:hypothetical protein